MVKKTAVLFSFAEFNAARTAASSSSSKMNPLKKIAEEFEIARDTAGSISVLPPSNGQGPRSYREQKALHSQSW